MGKLPYKIGRMYDTPTNIDDLATSYNYSTDSVLEEFFAPIANLFLSKISEYDHGHSNIGRIIAAHLKRTSMIAEEFLVQKLDFAPSVAYNVYQANLFQDLGKIHSDYKPEIWYIPHRPTEEERDEKRRHPERGVELVHQVLEAVNAPEKLKNHPHIQVITSIQHYHHERIDGAGYYNIPGGKLGQIIKAICIIDAYDGDLIIRPQHVKNGTERTPENVLERLCTDKKYKDAFDSDILQAFVEFQDQLFELEEKFTQSYEVQRHMPAPDDEETA